LYLFFYGARVTADFTAGILKIAPGHVFFLINGNILNLPEEWECPFLYDQSFILDKVFFFKSGLVVLV